MQVVRRSQYESIPFLQSLVVGSKSTMVVIANLFVTFQYGIQDGLRKKDLAIRVQNSRDLL